ncbi:hypothetical protein OOK27_22420 [Streptomyces canus]|uniref:hypothetical protein n=1 Tax=Streptomyces canus TaxID=58343 RepID=UPI00225ACDDB|nr:hypothetical protein [Streptomyces canus]MCX5256853.1 hypothetical protein [Streptomyces canus]
MTHSDEAGRLSVERTAAGRGLPTAQFVSVSAFGICIPATIALGQSLGRTAPGAASALPGGLQFLFGALASCLVGLFGENSSRPMGLIMLIALALAALCLFGLVRPWDGHGEVGAH